MSSLRGQDYFILHSTLSFGNIWKSIWKTSDGGTKAKTRGITFKPIKFSVSLRVCLSPSVLNDPEGLRTNLCHKSAFQNWRQKAAIFFACKVYIDCKNNSQEFCLWEGKFYFAKGTLTGKILKSMETFWRGPTRQKSWALPLNQVISM